MESESLVNVYTQLIFIKHLKQEYQEFKLSTINVHSSLFALQVQNVILNSEKVAARLVI